jgi:molecular chaperone GrpE
MTRRKTPEDEMGAAAEAQDATPSDAAESPSGEGPPGTEAALVEPAEQAVHRLTDELEQLRDRYLRLAAEFENYKKRVARERAETWARAQADVVSSTLDALDDLGRVTRLDPAQATAQDVLSGIELVERKLLRELEGAGLERVGKVGEDFDPHLHEAVGAVPAASAEDDGTVAEVLQVGYRFGAALLRPARVRVSVAAERRAHEGSDGTGGPPSE